MTIPFAWQQFLDFFGTLAFTVSFSLVIMSRITVSASSALPRQQITKSGPGTKGRRQALAELMGYMEKRLDRMRYGTNPASPGEGQANQSPDRPTAKAA